MTPDGHIIQMLPNSKQKSMKPRMLKPLLKQRKKPKRKQQLSWQPRRNQHKVKIFSVYYKPKSSANSMIMVTQLMMSKTLRLREMKTL